MYYSFTLIYHELFFQTLSSCPSIFLELLLLLLIKTVLTRDGQSWYFGQVDLSQHYSTYYIAGMSVSSCSCVCVCLCVCVCVLFLQKLMLLSEDNQGANIVGKRGDGFTPLICRDVNVWVSQSKSKDFQTSL